MIFINKNLASWLDKIFTETKIKSLFFNEISKAEILFINKFI